MKIGDFFKFGNQTFILARVSFDGLTHDVCLVCLQDGRQWGNPVKITDPYNISEKESYDIGINVMQPAGKSEDMLAALER